MSVLLGNPAAGTMNTPVPVELPAVTFPRGDGEVPQVTPSAAMVELPVKVIFPPRVAAVAVIKVDVGAVMVIKE